MQKINTISHANNRVHLTNSSFQNSQTFLSQGLSPTALINICTKIPKSKKAKEDQRDKDCAGEAELLNALIVACAAGICNMPDKFKFKDTLLVWHAAQTLPKKGWQTPEVSVRSTAVAKDKAKLWQMSDVWMQHN